jgi:acyl-CoA dehydrogenase
MTRDLLLVLDEEARRTDTEGIWPERSVQALRGAGLLGLTLPDDSNAGAGMRRFAEITEKIATRCASTAMICAGYCSIALSTVHRGSETDKRR